MKGVVSYSIDQAGKCQINFMIFFLGAISRKNVPAFNQLHPLTAQRKTIKNKVGDKNQDNEQWIECPKKQADTGSVNETMNKAQRQAFKSIFCFFQSHSFGLKEIIPD